LEDGDMITVDPSVIPVLKRVKNEKSREKIYKFSPVDYMQPWMFLPDYLEVNYATASAVFLRSPLPQPNHTEIPSPHPPAIHALAYDWYVRRSKANRTKRHIKPLIINGRTVKLKSKFDRMVRKMQQTKRSEGKKKLLNQA